ncbi:MAG TPA: 30S ribosomal protein S4e [Candidatus Acidoferrales bacterium]|nr:30S ribosomal protein S4e [Candidatus Acidoferrales bacterium]
MHQKRISAPKSWPIAKKISKWVVAPSAGAHSKDAVPIMVVIRDMLRITDNAKETKRVLHDGAVKINGKVVKEYKARLGLFDVLSVAGINYRMLPNPRGKYELSEISDDDARSKLSRIDNITIVKGGKYQYNLHDGTNLLLDEKYNTKDSLVLALPDNKILMHYEYKQGSYAMIVGGRHSGETGKIAEIKKVESSRPNIVKIEQTDRQFETIDKYVFVLGGEMM